MNRPTARLTHAAWFAVTGSGLVLAWMAWFRTGDDPFAVDGHPWQSTVTAGHILVAPLFVFAAGLLWQGHVVAKVRSRQPARRRSGILLVVVAVVATASGYGLQVATAEGSRTALAWLHGVSGAGLLVTYLVHQLLPRGGSTTRRTPSPRS